MRRIILFLSFLLLQSQSFVHAAPPPVFATTLDNGLKILVKEDHRAPIAVAMIWYNVGSSDEVGGSTGLSHALEHMMFRGTKTTPTGEFSKAIAALGGEDNAFTSYDYTAYYEKIPADKLAIAFAMEADRMHNLLLNRDLFIKEMQVIQEERRMRTEDSPQGLSYERFMSTAHLSTPYQHPVIGWMYDIEHMQVEDLRAWYTRYYAPNNATLVVIGDVQPQAVVDLAKKYFGQLKPEQKITRKLQIEPPALGKKFIEIHAPAQVPLSMMGFTVPGVLTAEKPWEPYALEVIAGILDGGESSRFARYLIRGEQPVASQVSVWYNPYTRYQSQFTLFGSPNQNHTVADVQKAFLKQLQILQNEPVSQVELDRVKTQIIAQKTFEKDSIFSQAMELGLLETIGAGFEKSSTYVDQIQSVTPEQIQATAKKYFQENAMTIAQLIPTGGKQ